ncbi:MAG TPA: hypothetical protein VE818_01865 [Nitrososphaeraceae archaeon]|nr:hypothetical protein [Nitrososphaeraceae archaeon]
MVIIPSEYFQIITAGIYAIALFYTIVTFRRTKRLDQIILSNNIFNDLRDLDRELAKIPSGSQYDNARSPWYCSTFNTLDWLSFLINEKVINERKMIEYMKPIIVRYYEDTFLKNASVDEKDSKSYQQFKTLYQTIKN